MLDKLLQRREAAVDRVSELFDLADAENRDLTDAELKEISDKEAEIKKVDAQILTRQNFEKSAGRKTSAQPGESDKVEPQAKKDHGTHGFESMGHFAQTVRAAAGNKEDAALRLKNAATTYGQEAVGSDGGFAVPPDFKAEIWKKVLGSESLFARGAQVTTGSNAISWPKDETTPWQTSGGILCYWENEAGVITQSKPALELDTLKLNKLTALVPVSDELLEDAPSIDAYIRMRAPEKMTAKLNTAVVRGTGVGQLHGILNANSLITVAAEVSQNINTIVYANIVNMWSRLYAPCRANAVWLVNQDVEPQLYNLAFRENASSPVPAYMPANGLSASPYGTLMGRPVVPVEPCSTLGTVGDIILVDMAQYMALSKGGIKQDVSMHLYFDQSAQALRFVFRAGGKPFWTTSVTPENGTMTRSWAVALETRP